MVAFAAGEKFGLDSSAPSPPDVSVGRVGLHPQVMRGDFCKSISSNLKDKSGGQWSTVTDEGFEGVKP